MSNLTGHRTETTEILVTIPVRNTFRNTTNIFYKFQDICFEVVLERQACMFLWLRSHSYIMWHKFDPSWYNTCWCIFAHSLFLQGHYMVYIRVGRRSDKGIGEIWSKVNEYATILKIWGVTSLGYFNVTTIWLSWVWSSWVELSWVELSLVLLG